MKKIVTRILITVLTIPLAIALGEASIRILRLPTPTYTSGIYDFPCYTTTPTAWLALKPNTNCMLRSRENAFPNIDVYTNGLGLRNKELTLPKPNDTYRIVFLGDSFTFGFGVDESQAYPRIVERFIQNKFPKKNIETVNAGMPVVGSGRYYLRMNDRPYAHDADIIVVGLYLGNDLYDDDIKPVWIDENDDGYPERIESATAYVDHKGNLVSKNQPWLLGIPYISDWYMTHLLTAFVLRLQKEGQNEPTTLIPKRLCLFQPNCHMFDEEIEKRKELYLEMQSIADKRNQKLMFVFIPTEFQVDEKSRWKYQIPIPLSPAQQSYPNRQLAEFFTQHHIEYLDLLPTFATSSAQAYFTRDDHWNELGHELAAEAIADEITKFIHP